MLFNMVGKSGGGGALQYAAKQFSRSSRFTATNTGVQCLLTFPNIGDYFVLVSYFTQIGTQSPNVSNTQLLSDYITAGDVALTALIPPASGYYRPDFFVHVNAANSTLQFNTKPLSTAEQKTVGVEIVVIALGTTTNNVTVTYTNLEPAT